MPAGIVKLLPLAAAAADRYPMASDFRSKETANGQAIWLHRAWQSRLRARREPQAGGFRALRPRRRPRRSKSAFGRRRDLVCVSPRARLERRGGRHLPAVACRVGARVEWSGRAPHGARARLDLDRDEHQRFRDHPAPRGDRRRQGRVHARSAGDRRRPQGRGGRDRRHRRRRGVGVRAASPGARGYGAADLSRRARSARRR